jgi:hypothetical protein
MVRGEWLASHIFLSIAEAQIQATVWMWVANNERVNVVLEVITLN